MISLGIQIALTHKTHYNYDKPVLLGPQLLRLRPAPHGRTPILNYSLKVVPPKHVLYWQQDPHNNYLARLIFPEQTNQFSVDVDLIADLTPRNPFDFLLEPGTEDYPFQYTPALAKDLAPYLATEPAGPMLQAFLGTVPREKTGTVSFLMNLNARVRDYVGYVTRMDPGVQTCEQTLQTRTGSCRDSGWLLVQALRHQGIAARFVSGYLIQLAEEDSSALHAWAEAFLPGAGWIGLDPTSGMMAGEGHIPLACTPDASDAAPITGTVQFAQVDFRYDMSVRRLQETPPPATLDDWTSVEKLAQQVDADLAAGDVRLTMGGEPTFVGLDEPDSPQWNSEALGAQKRTCAVAMIRGLRDKLAPGSMLHFGQGKWYPGEPFPRWAMNCFWRADGVPIWEDAQQIAQEDQHHGFVNADALQFLQALSRRLQVSAANILPAYEDIFYYLWRERTLPVNVEVTDAKLADPLERKELARVFGRGLQEPVGYVLPIRRRQKDNGIYWSSQLWFLRPERVLLMQGDSPLGYRLRLDSLPWVAPDDIDYDFESDPFADREKLPSQPARRMDLFDLEPPADPLPSEPQTGESEKGQIRPALCVEAREGRLHVFLPYMAKLPDYLDLLAAIEDTCAHLNKPVWLEGYTPPSDPRLRSFSITPDPGVLEVNLPPAASWNELQQINHLVFEEARANRLTAEKFLHDGTHMPTGGGNHIVLGGPTAADSALLRRPDLLRSLVTFWQHHPSLSYLFSGRFIGPTSQYPRVDEARMDALYELEIAFSQLPSGECPPWLVDRLFRNLLVDLTGNTHRAEFCIDKLYPPQGSGSRLGLLEMRAFEMAPHVQMGLLPLLLIRALVSLFWKQPYEHKLVRWGTGLHDRFLLPEFVKQDFYDVLGTLRRFGYPFDNRWFDAHLEFRFPRIGSVAVSGLQLELRKALEPWHVLGEEASASGTARSVDSSLERLQVKLSGTAADSRYVVACNGRKVPLQAAAEPGQNAAGVRYRAWQPPSCLHPTIPVHSPLVFDIIDSWTGLGIGGCAYHVTHPEGRWYETRPAEAAEAESRRLQHFQPRIYTPEPMAAPREESNPQFPATLDLRWPAPLGS